MTTKISKPVVRKYLRYLDKVLNSGETNMYDARPYLTREFPELSGDEAKAILYYWMETYSIRHGGNA